MFLQRHTVRINYFHLTLIGLIYNIQVLTRLRHVTREPHRREKSLMAVFVCCRGHHTEGLREEKDETVGAVCPQADTR